MNFIVFSVKLYPNKTYGYVEMLTNASTSRYSLICSDGFGDTEASVACRQLGLEYGVAFCCNAFGHGQGYHLYETSSLTCSGNEYRLQDCNYSRERCQSNGYASVVCSNVAPRGKSTHAHEY